MTVGLSIVVVAHDMVREAPRTVRSLSPDHQQGLVDSDYEIIVIDNGSTRPLEPDAVTTIAPNVRYHYHETTSPSPAAAVNLGVELASADFVAIIVDGARMASPGLVGWTQRAVDLADRPFVSALSWHLGPQVQNESMRDGYDQETEDALLETIGWPTDGYALFGASTLAQSSRPGFLGGVPVECSWIAMRREDFDAVGRFDERFQSPGGGLVNQDFRDRVMSHAGIQPIVLLGEGVFHQFHGGVATNVPIADHPFSRFEAEYEQIHGTRHTPSPTPGPFYLGHIREEARPFIARQ